MSFVITILKIYLYGKCVCVCTCTDWFRFGFSGFRHALSIGVRIIFMRRLAVYLWQTTTLRRSNNNLMKCTPRAQNVDCCALRLLFSFRAGRNSSISCPRQRTNVLLGSFLWNQSKWKYQKWLIDQQRNLSLIFDDNYHR